MIPKNLFKITAMCLTFCLLAFTAAADVVYVPPFDSGTAVNNDGAYDEIEEARAGHQDNWGANSHYNAYFWFGPYSYMPDGSTIVEVRISCDNVNSVVGDGDYDTWEVDAVSLGYDAAAWSNKTAYEKYQAFTDTIIGGLFIIGATSSFLSSQNQALKSLVEDAITLPNHWVGVGFRPDSGWYDDSWPTKDETIYATFPSSVELKITYNPPTTTYQSSTTTYRSSSTTTYRSSSTTTIGNSSTTTIGNSSTTTIAPVSSTTTYQSSSTTTVTLSIGEAVDNTSLPWTTGGDANWFGQAAVSYYDGDAAQSGDITDYQSSWVQTTVTGPGTLTFYWKVSSELNWDYLIFYIDEVEQSESISGAVDWQQKTYSIASGSHTLKWAYTKDFCASSGSDAGWLDKVALLFSDTLIPCLELLLLDD